MTVKSAWTLTVVTLILLGVKLVQSQCITSTNVATTNETAPPGTFLLNLTRASNSSNATFQISQRTLQDASYRAELETYFLLSWNGMNGVFSINKTLDLEYFSTSFNGAVLTTITVDFICNGPSFPVPINNEEVNEFKPVFIQSPYNLSLSEARSLGDTGFTLLNSVSDQDVPPPANFFFGIEDYLISEFDGKDFFSFGASTLGNLMLVNRLDYNIEKELRLNVSVKDSQGGDAKVSFTTVYISVSDADNQDPYFNLTGCPKPCIAAPYFAVTDLQYVGPLTIRPEPFHIVDDDTLGTTLLLSIESGDDNGMFSIDPISGTVQQIRSVTDANYPNDEIRLVIQVRKNLTSIDLSNIAILTVQIAGRAPVNVSDIPRQKIAEDSSGSSLLIPVIALAIILALVITAMIVIFILIRKKQRKMTVNPDAETKSEPQTEEEELHTDRSGELPHVYDKIYNNKLVQNGKTTQGMSTDPFPPTPVVQGGVLPPLPLRDSATETVEGRKKKRTRRRNKVKEPEIFDGTKEYNMGADPEFFDSTDKSKVKRSQRSYDKKVDPALWIKVPNDNPSNYDSGFSG